MSATTHSNSRPIVQHRPLPIHTSPHATQTRWTARHGRHDTRESTIQDRRPDSSSRFTLPTVRRRIYPTNHPRTETPSKHRDTMHHPRQRQRPPLEPRTFGVPWSLRRPPDRDTPTDHHPPAARDSSWGCRQLDRRRRFAVGGRVRSRASAAASRSAPLPHGSSTRQQSGSVGFRGHPLRAHQRPTGAVRHPHRAGRGSSDQPNARGERPVAPLKKSRFCSENRR